MTTSINGGGKEDTTFVASWSNILTTNAKLFGSPARCIAPFIWQRFRKVNDAFNWLQELREDLVDP